MSKVYNQIIPRCWGVR